MNLERGREGGRGRGLVSLTTRIVKLYDICFVKKKRKNERLNYKAFYLMALLCPQYRLQKNLANQKVHF